MRRDLSNQENTQTLQLQGSVSITSEINRDGGGIVRVTIHADEAEYDERTGEITRRGHVSIQMEQK